MKRILFVAALVLSIGVACSVDVFAHGHNPGVTGAGGGAFRQSNTSVNINRGAIITNPGFNRNLSINRNINRGAVRNSSLQFQRNVNRGGRSSSLNINRSFNGGFGRTQVIAPGFIGGFGGFNNGFALGNGFGFNSGFGFNNNSFAFNGLGSSFVDANGCLQTQRFVGGRLFLQDGCTGVLRLVR